MITTLFETAKVNRKNFREALSKKTKQGKAKEISFEEAVKLFFVPIYFSLYGEDFKFSDKANRFLYGDKLNDDANLK